MLSLHLTRPYAPVLPLSMVCSAEFQDERLVLSIQLPTYLLHIAYLLHITPVELLQRHPAPWRHQCLHTLRVERPLAKVRVVCVQQVGVPAAHQMEAAAQGIQCVGFLHGVVPGV